MSSFFIVLLSHSAALVRTSGWIISSLVGEGVAGGVTFDVRESTATEFFETSVLFKTWNWIYAAWAFTIIFVFLQL